MMALPGAAFAAPSQAKGSGGHFSVPDCFAITGVACTGGGGGSDTGSGGGDVHVSGGVDPIFAVNGGFGQDGSANGGEGGGSGGCFTSFGERSCGSPLFP